MSILLTLDLFLYGQLSDDFSLEDMPTGHPSITREALESIGEYAFVILRGMTMVGGQVKIYHSEINRFGTSPSEQVTSILKPAALAYLEVESTVPKNSDGEHALNFELDRSNVELDFKLSQKAYALTINAMSALAMNRPVFFNEAAACLARRAVQPPLVEDGHFSKAAVLVVASQLRASCLTLLRNASSVTTGASDILFKALVFLDMELQAEKALKMANQANELKTAGRAARNQAKMFYEWDASENDRRSTKRQKETDDALAKMRAAKRQRGLGGGIQLPSSMSDAIELILLNLPHLPKTNPSPSTQSSIGAERVTLEYVIDAVMTNGASIIKEEGRWYDRNGGTAWTLDLTATENYVMCPKFSGTINHVAENLRGGGKLDEHADTQDVLFRDQCSSAASDAFNRILAMATSSRSKYVANLSSQLAARLAFTLQSVPPSGIGNAAHATAKECISTLSNRVPPDEAKMLIDFVDSYPLVAASLTLASSSHSDPGDSTHSVSTLGNMLLNEAFLQATWNAEATKESFDLYDVSLNVFVASVVHSGQLAKDKPSDTEKKRAASQASAVLQKYIATLPRLTKQSLVLLSALCDIDDITKKANKPAQEEVAAAASAHAAKSAAEKRATAALLILRDIAFQKNTEVRMFAVECAVGIASGRLPASPGIQDKALKLAMNVLFTKNDAMGALVADAARSDLEWAAAFAIEQFSAVQVANNESQKVHDSEIRNPLGPRSETEKVVLEKVRKPAVLFMALCVRRPEMIQTLFSLSCQAKADVLSKAVRLNMVKLSRAAGVLHGVAAVALQVAEMTGLDETSMLLAFLENLAPTTEKNAPNQEIIDACFQIQETMFTRDGKKDARYLIPIVSFIKRIDLVNRLHEFVAADDNVFLAALVRMGDRVGRLALHFREEPDAEHPSLLGMTLCEQLVYLHRLDFNATCLPQKRYLSAIKLCLENDEIFSDRVLMSAIDEMSGQFLSGSEKLPLAFMRTNIIVCSKYESLHSWICQVLLPRLVEGKIWNDLRQWEGWMRCAHMLEKSGDPSVDSTGAIETLPAEQLAQYRTKWAATGSIPP